MNDCGATNLIAGIIKQAVDDYAASVYNIWSLNHEVSKHIEAIKREHEKKMERHLRKNGERRNPMTNEEAELIRQDRVRRNKDRIEECESFFSSNWYKTMTEIPGERVLQLAKKTAEKRIQKKMEELGAEKCDMV